MWVTAQKKCPFHRQKEKWGYPGCTIEPLILDGQNLMHLLNTLHSAQDKYVMCVFTREEAWLSNSSSKGSSMVNSAFEVEESCGKDII